MFSFPFSGEIKEENLLPCYFLYGEETFFAEQLVKELKKLLISPDEQGFNLERFDLQEARWADIIDLARTVPFFFSPWRIILVEADENAKGRLTSVEEEIIREYFSSPSSRTILVVVLGGKVKKTHPLVRFFSSLPSAAVRITEMKPLKEDGIISWIERRLGQAGKQASPEAMKRLAEIIGSDLRMVDNELEKIITFVDDKKVIDNEDVNLVCDWVKTFFEWELTNSLEKAEFRESLLILNNRFREGIRAEYILGTMANFFRDILLAKIWLKEGMDRKEIFATLKPRIQEKYRTLYATKFREFFSLVEEFSEEDLNHALAELGKIDLILKTSDSSAQVLLEGFVYDYCRRRKKRRLSVREKGRV